MSIHMTPLLLLLLLPATGTTYQRVRLRQCFYCPKPISRSISECQAEISALQRTTLRSPVVGDDVTVEVEKEQGVARNMSNKVLAGELGRAFGRVRCYAVLLPNVFTNEAIEATNGLQLGLTEVNKSPAVCVRDTSDWDCLGAVLEREQSRDLQYSLARMGMLLQVLLQKVEPNIRRSFGYE